MKPASSPSEKPTADNHRRDQLTRAIQRDFKRRSRRDETGHSFWQSLGVLGMVGWPLAVTTVGGAWLGHFLDMKWETGIQFTLLLLTVGVLLGSLVVWQVLGGNRS